MKLYVVRVISGVNQASYIFYVIKLCVELDHDLSAHYQSQVLRLDDSLKGVSLIEEALHEDRGGEPDI